MPEAKTLREFMRIILDRAVDPGLVTTYRGLSDYHYDLTPSVFRKNLNREQEHVLLRELIASHPDEFASDQSTLEQLVRMQHYALPTRLLDVSFNPLVALYFAAQEDKKRVEIVRGGKTVKRTRPMSGDVVVLSVKRSRVKYFDSDTISCIANLARLNWAQKEKIDTSLELEKFNKTMPIRRLVHFIRQEKYQFEPEIVPEHLEAVSLVKPKLNNKRILAQNGAFFILGLTTKIDEPNRLGIQIERIRIPADAKDRIRDELDRLNVNEKSLFPEIERAAKYLATNLQNGLVSTIVSKP